MPHKLDLGWTPKPHIKSCMQQRDSVIPACVRRDGRQDRRTVRKLGWSGQQNSRCRRLSVNNADAGQLTGNVCVLLSKRQSLGFKQTNKQERKKAVTNSQKLLLFLHMHLPCFYISPMCCITWFRCLGSEHTTCTFQCAFLHHTEQQQIPLKHLGSDSTPQNAIKSLLLPYNAFRS